MVRSRESRREGEPPPFAVAFKSRVDEINRDLHERGHRYIERQPPGEPLSFLAQTRELINSISQPLAIGAEDLRFVRGALSGLFMVRSGWGYRKERATELAAAIEEKSGSAEAVDLLLRAMTRLAIAHPSAHTLMIPRPVGRGPDVGLWRNMAEAFQETSNLLQGKESLGPVPGTLQRAGRLLRCRPFTFSEESRLEFASVVAIAVQDRVVRAGHLDDSLARNLALRICLAHRLWHGIDVRTVLELCSFWQDLSPDKLKSDEGIETGAEKSVREQLAAEIPPRLLLEFLAQGVIREDGDGAYQTYKELGLGEFWRSHRKVAQRRRARQFVPHEGRSYLRYSGTFDPTHVVHALEMALGAAMALNLHTYMVVNKAPKKGSIADFPARQEMALMSTRGLEEYVTIWPSGGADADAPARVVKFEEEFLGKYNFQPEVWLLKGTDDTKLEPISAEYLLDHEAARLRDYRHVWKLRAPLLRVDNLWATLQSVQDLFRAFGEQTTVLWPTLVGVSSTEIRGAIRDGGPAPYLHGDVIEMAKELYR